MISNSSISPEQMKAWNQQGLIPGPDETEEEFLKRAQFCLNLGEELAKQTHSPIPFKTTDQASQSILTEATQISRPLFDIAPTWVPLFFNNYQLSPWHGGCAWIFQLTEETPTSAFLQLRKGFHDHSRYLGLYDRHELISHELAHVGRMMYQEPQFEEILAYQTSSSRWRRWLGPIVQSSKESMFFIILLGAVILADLASLTLHPGQSFPLSLWLKEFLMIILLFAIGRLGWRFWLLNRCLHQLTEAYQDSQSARHLLYRLRDHEIRTFASASPEAIKETIQAQLPSSFRWRFLMQNYPLPFC